MVTESRPPRRLLVIGAHSADFVWRAGGALAVCTAEGGSGRVIALSYGERGESGELWKQPDQTIEHVKRVRHDEAERAAEALGADFHCLDLGDYPLEIDTAALEQIAEVIRRHENVSRAAAHRRAEELLDGGSLYWVIKGQIAARQKLIALRPLTRDGVRRCGLVYDKKLVPVIRRSRAAFQGWRYLAVADAPRDLDKVAKGVTAMPEKLRRDG